MVSEEFFFKKLSKTSQNLFIPFSVVDKDIFWKHPCVCTHTQLNTNLVIVNLRIVMLLFHDIMKNVDDLQIVLCCACRSSYLFENEQFCADIIEVIFLSD